MLCVLPKTVGNLESVLFVECHAGELVYALESSGSTTGNGIGSKPFDLFRRFIVMRDDMEISHHQGDAHGPS